jgi:16S rRNA processing protein RimM
VLKLRGVDSITQAEAFRDAELGIPESELETLPPGSYYYHQLSGLEVVDEQGAPLGKVASVMDTGAETRVLVVQGPRGETLVPFAQDFVRSVDLVHGVLSVVRPEYVDAD